MDSYSNPDRDSGQHLGDACTGEAAGSTWQCCQACSMQPDLRYTCSSTHVSTCRVGVCLRTASSCSTGLNPLQLPPGTYSPQVNDVQLGPCHCCLRRLMQPWRAAGDAVDHLSLSCIVQHLMFCNWQHLVTMHGRSYAALLVCLLCLCVQGGLRLATSNTVRVRLTLQGLRVNSYVYLDEVSVSGDHSGSGRLQSVPEVDCSQRVDAISDPPTLQHHAWPS
jgi:hypothetical protein